MARTTLFSAIFFLLCFAARAHDCDYLTHLMRNMEQTTWSYLPTINLNVSSNLLFKKSRKFDGIVQKMSETRSHAQVAMWISATFTRSSALHRERDLRAIRRQISQHCALRFVKDW